MAHKGAQNHGFQDENGITHGSQVGSVFFFINLSCI